MRSNASDRLLALVVDDSAPMREVGQRLFERLGYLCDVVEDGESALAATESSTYAVLLVDVEMPGITGIELAKRISGRRSEGARPWIIVMTGGATPEVRTRATEAGADAFLQKPIELKMLRDVLPGATASPDDVEIGTDGVLDEEAFRELVDLGQGEFVTRLLSTFDRDANRLVETMERSLAEGTPEELARAAHALKGTAATLGARQLQHLCQRIETMAASDPQELEAALADLRPTMGRAQHAWRAELERNEP